MSKMFWAVMAAIIIIFGGIVIFNKEDTTNAKPTNHIYGEGQSGVTLVEYGDFECSACGRFYPLVGQLKEKYKKEIFFQFRNLPLIQPHPNAFAAARAAEAANKQGKFWEMHDLLFQNQTAWGGRDNASAAFEQYATQLGLDLAKFKADAASAGVNDIINADITEFKKTKEKMSTPTFFLEGKRIEATSLEESSQLIDRAIAEKAKD